MNFLLKIIEGPNKGAEAALIEGVAVTLGKSDDCDIVLADATMPDKVTVSATADGVTIDGEALLPLHVKALGATFLAVGPADSPWGELVWEEPSKPQPEAAQAEESPKAEEPQPETPDPAEAAEESKPAKRHFGAIAWILVLLIILLAVIFAAWWYREPLKESLARFSGKTEKLDKSGEQPIEQLVTLEQIAVKYGLTVEGNTLSGNLATRSERLAVTAEAYSVQPGAELDLSDDESFKAAASDALFVLTEGALKVVSVKAREIVISGTVASRDVLDGILRSLAADLPKLRNVDSSGVQVLGPVISTPVAVTQPPRTVSRPATPAVSRAQQPSLALPVCGILTEPYPCLVMRDGRRIFEGAEFAGATIVKIASDSVELKDAAGRLFTWKP